MTMVNDETARILAERGTPEACRGYALMNADAGKRDAYTAARAAYDEAGQTEPALHVFRAAVESAHVAWLTRYAEIFADYARALGAVKPTGLSPTYNVGWFRGSELLSLSRHVDYSDAQWLAYVAGYADGARHHAEATEAAFAGARDDASVTA
jgi:hypothetical protein